MCRGRRRRQHLVRRPVATRSRRCGTIGQRVHGVRGAGTRVIKCPVRSPLVNATCERFLGSVPRECLEHIIILGTRHLRSTLKEYVAYFNAWRPHQGLKQRIPVGSEASDDGITGTVSVIPILGGLHHDYRRAA